VAAFLHNRPRADLPGTDFFALLERRGSYDSNRVGGILRVSDNSPGQRHPQCRAFCGALLQRFLSCTRPLCGERIESKSEGELIAIGASRDSTKHSKQPFDAMRNFVHNLNTSGGDLGDRLIPGNQLSNLKKYLQEIQSGAAGHRVGENSGKALRALIQEKRIS
jgi:hypothetical protein